MVLSNFLYRKSIPINPRPSGALSNYQVLVTVYSGSGTDVSGTVYLNNHSLNYPDDIRFTGEDGDTYLDYWIENYGENPSNIWIKVPQISETSTSTIYIYYGNASANYSGNAGDTFLHFQEWTSDLTSSFTEDHYDVANGETRGWISSMANYSSVRLIAKLNVQDHSAVDYAPTQYLGIYRDSHTIGNGAPNRIGFSFAVDARNGTDSSHFKCGIYSHSGSYASSNGQLVNSAKGTFRIYELNYDFSSSRIEGYIFSSGRLFVVWSGTVLNYIPPSVQHLVYDNAYGSNEYHYDFSWDSSNYLSWAAHRQNANLGWISSQVRWTAASKYKYPEPIVGIPGNEIDINSSSCSQGAGDIYISGCGSSQCYIRSWCIRWDESNFGITIETFLSATCRDLLFSNVVPGAVRELYNILGRPQYIDTTYNSGNTLKIIPSGHLANLHDVRIIAVKSISDRPVKGPSKYLNIKIEGKRLDI